MPVECGDVLADAESTTLYMWLGLNRMDLVVNGEFVYLALGYLQLDLPSAV